MQFAMYLYAGVFALILLGNCVFLLKVRGHWLVLAYELLSGGYLLAMTLVYFTPVLLTGFSRWLTLPTLAVIGIDFYLSIWGDLRRFMPETMDVSDRELEFAKSLSLLFAAPAYLTGCLLLLEKWQLLSI